MSTPANTDQGPGNNSGNSSETEPSSPPSARTRVRRNAMRAEYETEVIHRILDTNVMCHVAYVEDGEPRLIPTLYIREGDAIYLHGNRQSALLRAADAGQLLCVSVMAVHGVVVARSGFHCSMNYDSVIVFGEGEGVSPADHEAILDRFVDLLVPGHGDRVRRSTPEELNATRTIRVAISEASAKVRTGDPIDPATDLDSDVWAGQIPLTTVAGTPIGSADLGPDIQIPEYIRNFTP